MDPKDQKIATLEQQVRTLTAQVNELNRRMEYVTRENSRRKNDISQLANAIRKG